MQKVKDFIRWALLHVKPYTIPSLGELARPWNECGTEPWEYLFGSIRVKTTQDTLDYYFESHYRHQMTRAQYDSLTRDWDRNGYATDCQGLCDAYFTYEVGEKTDINAHMNYTYWCTDKGKISEIDRPYVIGEALFTYNGSKMKHVGWVCGFAPDGDPYVVEARGIAYGVVITKLSGRNWTHRGLMTKKFDYSEEPEMINFNIISPMPSGEPYLAMQKAINLAGFTDDEGKKLEEDGKWGKRSRQAFINMNKFNFPPEPPAPVEPKKYAVTISGEDGEKLYSWDCYL